MLEALFMTRVLAILPKVPTRLAVLFETYTTLGGRARL